MLFLHEMAIASSTDFSLCPAPSVCSRINKRGAVSLCSWQIGRRQVSSVGSPSLVAVEAVVSAPGGQSRQPRISDEVFLPCLLNYQAAEEKHKTNDSQRPGAPACGSTCCKPHSRTRPTSGAWFWGCLVAKIRALGLLVGRHGSFRDGLCILVWRTSKYFRQ